MTQEEIIYRNISSSHYTAPYHEYEFGTVGNVLHWLWVYLPSHIASIVTIDTRGETKKVSYGKKVVATYTHDDTLQVPVFTFIEEEPYLDAQREQDIYLGFERKKTESETLKHQCHG